MNKWKKSAAIAIATLSLFGFGTWGVKALLSPSKVQAETAEITQATPKMEIISQNVSYSESVYILYAVSNEGFDRNTNEIKMLFWETPQENYDVTTATYVAEDKGSATVKGEDCLVFYSEGLSAKEMTVDLYCRAYTEIDGETYYSDVKKYSVLEYVYEKREKGGLTEAQGFLFDAMLNYGAAAQTYFEYKTDRLATEAFTYVRIANAMFADGFDYGLYKAGAEVEITLKEGYQLNLEYAEYLKETEDGKIILTVPAEKTVDESSVVKTPEEVYSKGLEYVLSNDGIYYSVTDIGTCKDTDLIIPSMYKGLPVREIGEKAFYNCTNLISVEISDEIVKIGDSAFYGCNNLITVVFPKSLMAVGEYAFSYCKNLTKVYYTGKIADWCGITFGFIASPFCTSKSGTLFIENQPVTKLIIPEGITSISRYAFSCVDITSVEIADSVSCIGDNAFSACIQLTGVDLGEGVQKIEHSVFAGCTSLSDIIIPDSVVSIGGSLFSGCKNLVNVKIGNGITNLNGNTFQNCKSLVDLIIPDNVEYIAGYSFENCSNLTNLTIGKNVKSIGQYAFDGCDKMKNVYYNGQLEGWCKISFETASSIPYNSTTKGVLYINNQPLSEVKIPNDVESIAKYAFYRCSSLTSVVIPDSVTSIGYYAFRNTNLTSVAIPDSVSSIGDGVFMDCRRLTSVVIPKSVISIGYYAFCDCSSLTEVYYKGTAEEWTNISIDPSGNSYLTNATRYYYSKEEPALNADGTAYDGNYWHYVNDEVVVWTKTEEE